MNLPIAIKALNPEIPLKKHTATIHIEAPFTAVDHKCLNILYKAAYDSNSWNSEHYYLKYSDIAKFLGWKRIVMKDIAETLEKLRVSKIRWNILSQDHKNDEKWEGIGVTGFIASYMVIEEHNLVRFSISPEIKRLIMNPNIFSFIDLRIQKKLKSKYDLILYEILLDELTRSYEKENISRWYTINDIRRLYGLSPENYTEPRDFNKFCIREPIKSINDHTNLIVEIHSTERIKRTIVALQFKVAFKSAEGQASGVQTQLLFGDEENEMNKQYIAKEELAHICNSVKIADQIIDTIKEKYEDRGIDDFLDDYIKENIEYAKRYKAQNKIHSFVGYTRAAIENDYAGYIKKLDEEKIKVEKDKNKEIDSLKEKENIDAANKEWEMYEKEFNKLSSEEQKAFFEIAEKTNPFLKTIPSIQQKILSTLPFFIDAVKNGSFTLQNSVSE